MCWPSMPRSSLPPLLPAELAGQPKTADQKHCLADQNSSNATSHQFERNIVRHGIADEDGDFHTQILGLDDVAVEFASLAQALMQEQGL